MARYLVLFVADRADDGHADALRRAARAVPGAGFFDDPEAAPERTVGVFLRLEQGGTAAAQALVGRVAEVSARLAARIEIQLDEEILGHVVDGRADEPLARALEEALGR